LAVLILFLRHENAPFNVSYFGRLSWRPLSFQAKPAMSAVGTLRQFAALQRRVRS
jgi:hypothetical protein